MGAKTLQALWKVAAKGCKACRAARLLVLRSHAGIKDASQDAADDGHVFLRKLAVERQRDDPFAGGFGQRHVSRLIAVSIRDETLKMNGREVSAYLNALVTHLLQESVALIR